MVAFLPYGDSHIFTDCLSSYFLNDLLSFSPYNVLTKSLYTHNFPYDHFKWDAWDAFDHFKISYYHFSLGRVFHQECRMCISSLFMLIRAKIIENSET
jgi:hypothetical protein